MAVIPPGADPGQMDTAVIPAETPEAIEAALASTKPRGLLRRGWEVFAENKLALASLGMLVFIVLFCFVGPLIYHTDQVHTNLSQSLCPPSGAHPLGCDNVGYDQLGRLMVGGQTSLEVGFAAAIVAVFIGTLYGAFSGFIGGPVELVPDAHRRRGAVHPVPHGGHHPVGGLPPGQADHDLRHRRVLLAGRGPAGPRRDADPAHEGIRAGRQGDRRHTTAGCGPARGAERHRHDHRADYVRDRGLDHHPGRPLDSLASAFSRPRPTGGTCCPAV